VTLASEQPTDGFGIGAFTSTRQTRAEGRTTLIDRPADGLRHRVDTSSTAGRWVYCQSLNPGQKTPLPKKLTFGRSSQGSGSGEHLGT
jgi:hypothetical protein